MPVFHIDFPTAYGRLQGTLSLPDGGMRLSEFARDVMPIGQCLVDLMEAAYARKGRNASCAKGCAACCRQSIPISPPEAFMLADIVEAMPAGKREEVSGRFKAALDHFMAAGLGDDTLPPGATPEAVRALALAHHKQGVACPFLEDEACSIHADRPIACRSYLVTSPASICSDPEIGGLKAMKPRFSMGTVLALLSAEFMAQDPIKLPLVGLLEWSKLERLQRDRVFDSNLLGFRFLELLEEFSRNSMAASAAPVKQP